MAHNWFNESDEEFIEEDSKWEIYKINEIKGQIKAIKDLESKKHELKNHKRSKKPKRVQKKKSTK